MEKKKVATAQSTDVGFKKEIGLFGGVSIIGGIMIGSGIFYLGSYVLERTHMSMGWALLCWVIGGLVSLLGGLCFAELGASDPQAGGMTVYLNRAFHPIVGFLNGFNSWLLGGAGSIAAVAIALPTALKNFSPDMSEMTIKLIAVVLVVVLTAYNCFGVKQGAILQNISMVAKLIPIGIIMVGALIFGKEMPNLSLAAPLVDGVGLSFGGIIGMIAFATVATLWAYEGWTNLNTVAEEMKDVKKNLPRSIIIAIAGITLLYTLFNFAIYRVIPHAEAVSMIGQGNLYLGTEVANRIFGNAGGIIVTIGMVIAMFGSLNGMILAFPRAYYAMAKEGHFFNAYGKLSRKYNVPTTAIIGQGVISIVLIMLRNLNQLTSLVIFTSMLFNLLVVVSVFLYRKKFPDMERPYKVWLYPITVIITALIFFGLMVNTLIEDPWTALIGLSVPAVGCLFFVYFDKMKKAGKSLSGK